MRTSTQPVQAHDKTVSRSARLRRKRRFARAAAAALASLEPLEPRQLLSVVITGAVTLDESSALQNTNIAVTGEDNNDSDIGLSILQTQAATFYNNVFGGSPGQLGLSTTFPTQIGVAKSADNFITVTGPGTIVSLGFTKADGTALPVLGGGGPGVASGLSAINGGAISLFASAVLGNRMVVGVDSTGDRVLALFLDPNATLTSAKVWIIQVEAISNPDATNPDDPVTLAGLGVAAGITTHFNFDALHSGSNLFGTVGDATNALIVVAEHPVLQADGTFVSSPDGVIKTSQGGGPTTIGVNSQMFDPNEGAYFTYVKSPNTDFLAGAPNGLTPTEANDADNIQYSGGTLAATTASLSISQTQGNSPASLRLTAYDIAGSPQGVPFVSGLGSGTPVTITAVRVFDAAGHLVSSPTVTITNGVATVGNLQAGYRVEWDTSAPHDRVLVQGIGGKFDVGAFDVNQGSSDAAPLSGVRFEDDGPALASPSGGPRLIVDETNLAVNATASFAAAFSATFGADGQGATPVTYALSTPGGDSGLVDTASGNKVFLFKVGADIVGKAGVDAAAAASGPTVFVVSVDSSGTVTLDQQRAIVHPDATNPDDTKGLLANNLVSLSATVSDGDSDSTSTTLGIGFLLEFKDDGPSITATIVNAPTLTVDETNFANDATGSFAAQFSPIFGADGQGATPVSYALSTPGGASGLTDTATNQSVVLSLVSGQIEGRTATSNDLVFTVSVNSSGVVTLDQKRSVKHPNTTNPDDSVTLTSASLVVLTATATDGDADRASTPLGIGQQLVFKDDGPTIGPIANSIVDLIAGATVTKTLNGAVGADPNATPYTIDNFTTTLTVNGVVLKGVLSTNKQVVTYFADTNNSTVFGDAGDIAFYRLTLGETGAGTYTFEVLVNPPPAELHFDFEALHSGSNLFGTVGDATNALIVVAEHPVLQADGTFVSSPDGVIKTSQGGGPTTIGVNSQMFDPNEGAYFTYVKSPNTDFLAGAPNGLTPTEANDADNIQYSGGTLAATTASLSISQTQGNSPASLRLTAYDIAGSPQGVPFVSGLGSGTPVTITAVRVFDAAGHLVSSPTVTITNGVATVGGLQAGYRVEWDTSAPHDRVLVQGIGGKFDVGAFDILQSQPTPDQKLDFVVKATDGDGDSSTAGFSIGIDGTGIYDDGTVAGVTV